MKFGGRSLCVALTMAAMFGMSAKADTLFTLDPVGGAISGAPGDTIGWGFTFVNDTDWAIITDTDYVSGTSVGSYSDFASTDQFNIVGPSPETATLTEVFDPVAQTGVGMYVIDPGAVGGAESDGSIQLTYDLYDVDPFDPDFDPGADLVSSGNTISADASITVTASSVSAPEPASLGLWSPLMLLGFMAVARRVKLPTRVS